MAESLKDEIKRRLEANYSLKSIREDLISQGFSPKEVDKAIEEALKVFAKRVEKGASSAKSNIQRSPSLSIVKLGILEKIKMVLVSPRKLLKQ
ncbi:MAG: hypothetical protein QXJ96_00640 [Candidatus Aenigmatarchaeota archaeon]